MAPSPRAATPVVQPATPQSRPPSSPPQSSNETQTPAQPAGNPSPSVQSVRVLTKLEDMKVSDLKMELKKRNLPVSGPKPQLIERLKSFTQNSHQSGNETNGLAFSGTRTVSVSSDNPSMDMDVAASPSNQAEEDETHPSPGAKSVNCSPPPPPPQSPLPCAMDTSESSPPTSPSVSPFNMTSYCLSIHS